ncbi:MAG: M20 family metallopeptidase [Acidobacteriota bacterium]
MSPINLLEKVSGETGQIIDLLRAVIEHESPSTHKGLVDRLGSFIAEHMRRNNLSPRIEQRQEAGNIVWTEWEGTQEGRVLVLCHIDTVWEPGSLKRNPFRIEEGRLYGPGIYDMKSGVTASLKAQEYMARGWIKPKKKVRFLYTTDEETGSHASREIIEDFARQSDVVLVTEPPTLEGHLKTFRKGVGDFIVRVHGQSAHAGADPDKGVNAVHELARQILALERIAHREKGTTVTMTVVRGGERENVIPDRAEVRIDCRFRTLEEGERVDGSIRQLRPQLQGARLEVLGGINRPPMIRTERTHKLFEAAAEIAKEIGIDLQQGETGGASDGSYTAALGIPTLDGLGIPGDGAHALHEHISLDHLASRVALLSLLIERL